MKIKQKIMAIMMVAILIGTDLFMLAKGVMATEELTKQNSKTNNTNIEFNTYLKGSVHEQTYSIMEGGKMYMNFHVKENGYLKNIIVKLQNTNYELDAEKIQSEYIQKIENNTIYMNPISAEKNVEIELPITFVKQEIVDHNILSKISQVQMQAIYLDSNGNEKKIEKSVSNQVKWQNTIQAKVNGEIVKYLPYQVEGEQGVLMQAKIQTGLQENTLPIAQTNLEIEVPTIAQTKPERVSVIATKTKATNGLENGATFTTNNYQYDKENKKVSIQTKNEPDENGKIAWKQGEDEYLVTFTYVGKELYETVSKQLAQENGSITGELKVKANIMAYNPERSSSEQEAIIPYNIREQIGNISDFSLLSVDSISKGYLYANYEKERKEQVGESIEDKKQTTYEIAYQTQIYDTNIIKQVEFQTIGETIIGDQTYNTQQNITIKQIKINKNIFEKILGQEGKIEIYNLNQELLATIQNQTSQDEQGNFVIDLQEKNSNEIIVKTSAPINAGTLEIKAEKAFNTNVTYTQEQTKTFEKITVGVINKTNNQTLTHQINMLEPESKAHISLENENFTITQNEDVNIRVTLDTSNLYYALYQNPTIKIKLPSYITKVDIKNASLFMENGLKIKNIQTTTENGQTVILVELEGTQTQYTTNTQYQGTILVLTTNIEVDKLTPSHTSDIVMEYTNQNQNAKNNIGTAQTKLNFVAPKGVVAANGIKGYAENNQTIMSVSSNNQTATIETFAQKKIATVTGKVVNNYESQITDVVILGRVPSKDNKKIDSNEELGSTFNAILNTPINVTGVENYTTYYSENPNATKDLNSQENGWTTNATTAAKSYLIVTNNYTMKQGDVIDFSYNIEIPENLNYNNSSYEMYKVYYNNNLAVGNIPEAKVSPIMALATGVAPELSVELSSAAQTVREGQTVRMKAVIKNTGTTTANNVKVNIPKPNYVEMIGIEEGTDNLKTVEIGNIEPGQTTTVSYNVRMERNTKLSISEENIDENNEIVGLTPEQLEQIENSQKYPKEIIHKVSLTADKLEKEIVSNQYKMNLEEGKMVIDITKKGSQDTILQKGDKIQYGIVVTNISEQESLANTVILVNLPQGTKYVQATIKDALGETINEGSLSYDQASNMLTANLGNVTTEKRIEVELEVEEPNGTIEIKATGTANGVEKHESNVLELKSAKVELEIGSITSTPKYVKEGEKITYQFSIKNNGSALARNIKITDELPEGVTFEKAGYTYNGKTQSVTNLNNGKVEFEIGQIQPNETIVVTIEVIANLLTDENDKDIQNKVSIESSNIPKVETNSVTNTIEYSEEKHKGSSGGGNQNSNKPAGQGSYKISGTAWLDTNQNGQRDKDETLLQNVQVLLLDKQSNNSNISLEQNKTTKTDSQGKYTFTGLGKGEYVVVFLYDAAKYNLTTYQAQGIDTSLNSDAIEMYITLDGKKQMVGITDMLTIGNQNARDIDLGLYETKKFDLKLDKYISKITLTTPTIGTKTYTYNNSKLEKQEILGKNAGKSSMVIEYKIVVTNEGQVPGYAKKIVDYLPEGVGFSSELNQDWYLSETNGNVYNTSLANEVINPGESKELTIVLTKKITKESIGTAITNLAEIYESYNEQGLEDIDSKVANKLQEEDDLSEAVIICSVVTGKIVVSSILVLVVIVLIGFGAFEIKKRVLK